ncbi:glutathione synthetase isoform X2 [Parasteatoda tepidariorum]|uniref:glutathione synthetase isoform X2 n=1 Tax=Parasteatoda tepidariorum TaxID=114398 RepID=UPI0039BCEA04
MEHHILKARYGICDDNLSSLSQDAKDYALMKGISQRTLDLPKDCRVPLSFCLLPSFFSEVYFNKVYKLQTYINSILLKVSFSKEILMECLSNTIEADEFTHNIFKIYEAVENKEQTVMGIIRSDYLLHADSDEKVTGIKQVENNTISASFGGLAPTIKELHEFILERLGQKGFDHKLPLNESCKDIAKGIVSAWDHYECQNAIVLFVVEDETLNISDQRGLEYAILDIENKIEVMRCTFKELRKAACLKENKLYVKDKEVAVVYYRTGYVPDQYEAEDWEIRLLMEQSHAIKCPSAGLHLAGTKKVQAYLTRPGVLEKYVESNIADEIREVFANQYSLEMGSDGDEAIKMAIENPEKFVLKPEREGGGNNLYGTEIKEFLENIKSSEERNAYILMERINPPSIPNCIIQRNQPPEITNVIAELGIFGVVLGNKKNTYVNEFAGHLLRSKKADSDECGIAAGFGALDSPYLD